MKRLLAGLLLLVGAFTFAAEKEPQPKPNQLTAGEIAEGWILLFDGEGTYGWQSPNDSKWTVADGMLAPQNDKPGLLTTTTGFLEYELTVDYLCRARSKAWISFVKDRDASGSAELQVLGNSWSRLFVHVRNGQILKQRIEQRTGVGFGVTAKSAGPRKDPVEVRPQPITLSGNEVIFKNVKLKPLGNKPLFNGKDLSGWKVFPERKSKFTVEDGQLSIKNGPGDLQTEGSWSDFLLQLECRTNGKNLNSGVFFRCRPNEYQMGYEAQIHNGFLEQPTREYTIEEYDPKTNELKEKRKIKSASLDYGTGAIYRRIPARKQASKDQEWFTMTVVAEGRHLATWVNGVQTVDWTDNRPLKDNARNGCRLEAGPISLQGHDPTTDLSFRNIRLTDLTPRMIKDR